LKLIGLAIHARANAQRFDKFHHGWITNVKQFFAINQIYRHRRIFRRLVDV